MENKARLRKQIPFNKISIKDQKKIKKRAMTMTLPTKILIWQQR